jgi:hypothetical protein
MAFDVKRKAELSLVALLSEMLPGFTFYPSQGGTDAGGVTMPKPPFGAIWIDNAENTLPHAQTYLLTGTIVWVTRAEAKVSGDVAEHSDAVKQIADALQEIGSGADVERSLIICGIDITSTNEFSDAERQAHGDTITFTMGVNEFG